MENYNWTDKKLLQTCFMPSRPFSVLCTKCLQTIYYLNEETLQEHILDEHLKVLIEETEKYINAPKLRGYFRRGEDVSEIICSIDGCIISAFFGQDFLLKHLIKHHLPLYLAAYRTNWREANNQGLAWNRKSLVWRYFTPKREPTAECNICGDLYDDKNLRIFEVHLKNKHPEKIKRMLEEIKREIEIVLSARFEFDIENFVTRCFDCKEKVNYFFGTNHLIKHASKHNIQKADCLIAISGKSVDGSQRLTSFSEEYNTSRNIDALDLSRQVNTDSKKTEPNWKVNQEKLLSNRQNLAWEYFKPEGKSFAKCKRCMIIMNSNTITNLEKHLKCLHREIVVNIIRKIQKSIKPFYAEYFEFKTETLSIICTYCQVNIYYFDGIDLLCQHVREHITRKRLHENLDE